MKVVNDVTFYSKAYRVTDTVPMSDVKQGSEENIWTEDTLSDTRLEKTA
jgi:hypothetical protein